MATQISLMLAVSDPAAALEFYRQAFGAEELWRIGEPVQVAEDRGPGVFEEVARAWGVTLVRGERSRLADFASEAL